MKTEVNFIVHELECKAGRVRVQVGVLFGGRDAACLEKLCCQRYLLCFKGKIIPPCSNSFAKTKTFLEMHFVKHFCGQILTVYP